MLVPEQTTQQGQLVEAEEDFRSRTARRRRRETKGDLLRALFAQIEKGGVADVSVDDLRRACTLSRGAFYRYFDGVETMLLETAAAVGQQINIEMSERFDAEPDAVRRMSLHCRYFIERAASGRACALLLLHTMPLTIAISPHAHEHARADFAQALAEGELQFTDLDVAVELGHGMQVAMLRRALVEGFDPARLSAAVEIMLRGFGLDAGRAAELASEPTMPTDDRDLCGATIARLLD